MKMRKRIAALIAVVMIAALMPMSAFADSTNRVDKVVTVKKDSTIEVKDAPQLKIKMKDDLTTDRSFYLILDGAEWAPIVDADGKDITTALQNVVGVSAVTPQVITPATDAKFVKFTIDGTIFEAYREDGKTMAIKATDVTFDTDKEFIFPLVAKVTGDEAFIQVDKYDTEVSDSRQILFAVSDADKVKVIIGDAPSFYRSGDIAKITLEERYAGSLDKVPTGERWFTIELRDTDFTFGNVLGKVAGKRGYRSTGELNLTADTTRLSADRTRLGIKLPDTFFSSNVNERGILEITGIEIIADRNAKDGDVYAVIESKELFNKETIVVAKRGDYKTKLAVPKDWKPEVVAGTEKEVEFILSEELKNSLVGTRPVTFTFDNGVKIKDDYGSDLKDWGEFESDNIVFYSDNPALAKELEDILALPDGSERDSKLLVWLARNSRGSNNNSSSNRDKDFTGAIKVKGSDVNDDGDWSDTKLRNTVHVSKDLTSFTVDSFDPKPDKAGKYTFKVKLLIPAGVTGDITVEATGKGISEDKITVLEVEAPVEVEATKMDIKVGLKEIETTGKVVIKETAEERIAQGKNIVLRIDDMDNGLRIKSFKATVVEGDLVLEDRKDTNLAVEVRRASTKASTIEITDIVMSTDRTVPEGKYDLLVGGDAISRITGHANHEFYKVDNHFMDPVAVIKDFINITTKNTEDISGSANKAKVAFVVGSTEYLVNGKVENMDVAPYIKDGRTMVPVRYVAAALGVRPEQVIWDGVNQTATVLADKTIQVKLGSNMMVIDGVSVPMTAAAELTSDRTFVPVAEIARALSVPVAWDAANGTASFN